MLFGIPCALITPLKSDSPSTEKFSFTFTFPLNVELPINVAFSN
mgnify:CR=1 FL=1